MVDTVRVFKYLEKNGLKVVPVYEGSRPTEFLVVDTEDKIVARCKMLYEAEDFILSNRALQRGPTVGSAAELKSY